MFGRGNKKKTDMVHPVESPGKDLNTRRNWQKASLLILIGLALFIAVLFIAKQFIGAPDTNPAASNLIPQHDADYLQERRNVEERLQSRIKDITSEDERYLAYLYLGEAQLDLEKFSKALESFTKAAEIHEFQDIRVLKGIAIASEGSGEIHNALNYYRDLLERLRKEEASAEDIEEVKNNIKRAEDKL